MGQNVWSSCYGLSEISLFDFDMEIGIDSCMNIVHNPFLQTILYLWILRGIGTHYLTHFLTVEVFTVVIIKLLYLTLTSNCLYIWHHSLLFCFASKRVWFWVIRNQKWSFITPFPEPFEDDECSGKRERKNEGVVTPH